MNKTEKLQKENFELKALVADLLYLIEQISGKLFDNAQMVKRAKRIVQE